MESEDYSFYKGLVYLTEHNIVDLGYELTFSTEVNFIIRLFIRSFLKYTLFVFILLFVSGE